jgi:hypothetical protein
MLMKADFVAILGRENLTATLEDALQSCGETAPS